MRILNIVYLFKMFMSIYVLTSMTEKNKHGFPALLSVYNVSFYDHYHCMKTHSLLLIPRVSCLNKP